jgi:hypothetical protein
MVPNIILETGQIAVRLIIDDCAGGPQMARARVEVTPQSTHPSMPAGMAVAAFNAVQR